MSCRLSIQFLSLEDGKGQELSDVLIYLKKLKEVPTSSGTSTYLKEKDPESSSVFSFDKTYALSSDDDYFQAMFLKAETTPQLLVDEIFWLHGLYEILTESKATKKSTPELVHTRKLAGDYRLTFRLRMIEDSSAHRQFRDLYQIRGHTLTLQTFDRFVYCAICQKFIWGVSEQGLQCSECRIVLHTKCRDRIPFWCPLTFTAQPCLMTGNHQAQIEISHVFVPIKRSLGDRLKVAATSHCRQCGASAAKNALRCRNCDIIVHKECHIYLPPLCGTSYQILKNQLDGGSIREVFLTSDEPDSDSQHSLASTCSSLSSVEHRPPTRLARERLENLPKWADFTCIGRLGQGAFSTVYVALHEPTKEYVALKVVDGTKAEEKRQLENERDVLFRLSHQNPYIIKAYCTFHHGNYLFLVTEFVGGDTLYRTMTKKPLNEAEIRGYTIEMIAVLQYLHSQHVVYRDLKLEHIIVRTDGHIRLIDYGLAQTLANDEERCFTICGTDGYLAPEIKALDSGRTQKGYSYAVDYWALGIIFAQLLCEEQFSDLSSSTAESIDKQLSSKNPTEAARAFLHGLLEEDAEKRLGSSTSPHGTIREHAFFTCSRELEWTLVNEGRHKSVNMQSLVQSQDSDTFDGLPYSRSSLNRDCQQEWQEIGESKATGNIEREFQAFDAINDHIYSVFNRRR